MSRIIQKFGGTSVGSAGSIRTVVDIIRESLDQQPVVIVSAMNGVTDQLIKAAKEATPCLNVPLTIDTIADRHYKEMDDLGIPRSLIKQELTELEGLLAFTDERIAVQGRSSAVQSLGERMSSKIVAAAAQELGVPAEAFNSYDLGLLTASVPSLLEADVLPSSYSAIARAFAGLDPGVVPVVTGYIARDGDGRVTLLGRGSSDYSATIFGSALGASKVQIWTDADGIMTADPRLVPGARSIGEISYDEAAQLAYYGAKVMHPKAIEPASKKGIPIQVLNTRNRSCPGTAIVRETQPNGPITSITYKRAPLAVRISSPEMVGAPDYKARIFGVFGRHNISIDMGPISNTGVSVTFDGTHGKDISAAIDDLKAFSHDVKLTEGMASVTLVGQGIKDTPGTTATAFESVSKAGINVAMVSQGLGERCLSLAIEGKYLPLAVQNLHKAFFE
ncbi:aspartate kinase [Candidatus Woesearchaeota archaeon]|nr:aspartate kinase [Candidatus Woesearchaeota archaeon]